LTRWRVPLAYLAFSVLAIALFAIPLWYGWQSNITTFRTYVPVEEMHSLMDLFQREGAGAVTTAVQSRSSTLPRDEVLVFADPDRKVLAGTLRAWPIQVPDTPGTYGLVISLGGGSSMRVVASHVSLPGGYHLLMGRESVRFESLVERFWYGMAAALAVVLVLGAGLAWLLARSTRAVRDSEERYARAMDATEAGHWEWDLATHKVFHSPRFRELYGIRLDEEFADRDAWKARQPISAAERARQEQALQAAIADPTKAYDIELSFELRPGEVRWLRSRGKVFRDEQGRALRIAGATTDITPQKLAQEALRRSEQRFALAVAASNDGIFDWDLVTDQQFFSERAQRIFGHQPGPTLRHRSQWHALREFHPEDEPRRLESLKHHLAGETPAYEGEWRVRPIGGAYRWVHTRGVCVRDTTGRPIRMVGSITDIDERKRAEEALRESEKRHERAMVAAGAGFWDWDVAKDEFRVSPRLLEMIEFPLGSTFAGREDFMRRAPFDPEDREKWQQAVKQLFASDESRVAMDVRVVRSDGGIAWQRLEGMCFRDAAGNVVRWTGSTTDISERKHAEEALRVSEQRYARAMEGSDAGHWDWDLVTGEMFASERAREMLALPASPLPASRAEIMALVPMPAEDREAMDAQVATALQSGTHERDYRVLPRPGELRWVRSRGKVFRDAAGTAVRMTGSLTDITERKLAAGALRLSEQRYARAMDAAEAGHWEWNVVTDEMFVSTRQREMLDLPSALQFANREAYLAAIPFHPDDRERYVAAAKRHIAELWPRFEQEFRVVVKGGELRWMRLAGKSHVGADGRATHFTGSLIDITEAKIAEDALRLSEERYALAMEASEEGHFDWNLQNDEIFASSHMKKLLGLPTDAEFRTRNEMAARVRYYPGDRQRLDEMTRRVLGGTALQNEFDYRVLRGEEVRWLRRRWKIVRDAGGAALRVIGVLTDITERKLAADALRESEARFRSLTELSSDWYWRQDENLHFSYLSRRGRDATGLPNEIAIGKARWDFDNVTPLSGSWAEHKAMLAARQPFRDLELKAIAPDGKVSYLSINGAPIFDEQGEFKGYQGTGRNITERKRIEDDLRSRQEMLDLAQKSARAIAFEWKIGAGEGENRWSPDLEAMYGFAPGTYDGSFEMWKERVHPDDWPAVKDAINHAVRTGEVASEYRVLRSDRSVHWLQAKGRMFFDAAGQPSRMVGFMQDVTQRKQAEDELHKMEQELRRAQRLEAMGTLAGGIAHDFNNILGAIVGYGEMALRDSKKGTRLRRDLDAIMAAGERGRALIDRILAFSRSGVGERMPVHVEEVVREALDQLAAKLPESVTIAPRLHAARAAMLGDSTQVHQVVMNLANNAVQAMPHGGVLRVGLEAVRLEAPRVATVGSVSPGEYIVLRVSDTGTGIPPDVFERMFDPFFTTKEVGVGSGLGLSLVHGIVVNVGGAIEVATELGKGSTFTVYLPRNGDALEKRADENRPLPRGEGERVLVVDDEEPLVRVATETLERLGYEPIAFTSSAAALAAFRADPARFDAVLTDERMPGLSGSTLIREMRGIRDSIPVVLMSGYFGATPRDARETGVADALGVVPRIPVGIGADIVLKKPLSARDLAASMARALHR
jgi:PAS domain S-box-containing protein